MKKNRRLILAILTVTTFLLALAAEYLYFSNFEYHFRAKRFNRILGDKEKIMEDCMNGLKLILARGEPHGSVSENNLFTIAEQNEISILEYIDNKLIYWSDNGFDVPMVQDDSLFAEPIIFLQNGWFIPRTVQAVNETVVGLLRIRTDYGFENDIVKSGYERDFRMPDDAGFSTDAGASEFQINDGSGSFLFSITFPEVKANTLLILIPLFLWVSVFTLIILLSLELVRFLVSREKKIAGVFLTFLIFGLLYLSLLLFEKPAVIFRTGLFSPYNFSLNSFLPSLGHLLLLSILAAVFSYVLYRHLPLTLLQKEKEARAYLILTLFLGAGALFTCLLHSLFSQLVSDSNISFEVYKVLKLNFFSIAGFTSIMLLFLVPLLLILKGFQAGNQLKLNFIILPVLTSTGIIIFFYRDLNTIPPVTILFLMMVIMIWITGKRKTELFSMSVIFSSIIGIYSLYIITIFSSEKTTENLKVQALSFSTENDPEAEHLLLDLWPEINSDSVLNEMMDVEYFGQNDFSRIYSWLQHTYFGGYWGNFKLSIFLCRQDDPLRVGPGEDNLENCFSFFDERIRKYGHQLTGTGFYFIDNQGGRSYYLGRLFFNKSPGIRNGLYIELYSDVNVFQPGYSELLLDKKFRGYFGLRDYSFAKYINGEVVLKSGEFPYNKDDNEYIDKNTDYRIFSEEGFRHVLYKNGNATVIISIPELTFGDIIISLAYLFAYIFIFTNLVLLLIRRPFVQGVRGFNFRQKLQVSFIGILLFSFVIIGVVITFLTVNQYRTKHYENIKEKLNSIYLELDDKLSMEKNLSPDWRNNTNSSLNELLIKLSNIFNTDVNMYDLNGHLMATSREEIFYRNLAGRRMNNTAFNRLKVLTKSEYFQTEQVGSMKYISVYVPFYNAENNILAYLNLPYFRLQSLLAREISNLIVAVINFILLLILIAMSFAVFISNRLTSPLSMLSEGLASVQLGKKIEHLSYSGTDEIGELVKQYNGMVDELEQSANKLANSEREYAWREMAKQIAHEIKNPLTPMKLNIQQLLRSWKDDAPGFKEKLEVFSRNQIEYIDNLSMIASAFSSFAKLPGTNPSEVDLLEQIRTTLELFKNTDNTTFSVKWPHESKVFIFADREHLNGIFSNLFKNSIQAIPLNREGLIKVEMEVIGSKVMISVADNGTGIPEALKKKMFTPNFTTKSSGTGLGLSIVKKYVEGIKGRIWFESDDDKGTTFFIEFPLMYTVEKPGETNAV
ncbi:MAG: HAMP domain-containing histidine kinase [Bacteroidales bacterium]|nr:HAMP domain-containing histidine kinase [Bacteroidales bacterium]